MLGPHINNLLKFVYVGVIVGFVWGLLLAALHITNNEYFSYRVYNLILFDLQHYITKYSAVFILLSIAVAVPILLVNRTFSLNALKHPAVKEIFNKRVLGSVLISLILAYLIANVLLYYFLDIISFLKGSALSDLLGQFSDSKRDTRKIYKAILNIFGLAFIILSTYILLRFSISERVINALAGAVNSRVTGKIALTLAVALIIYNIFIFSYKRLYITQSPNVILISLDTVRADRMGSYGNHRDTSPNMDKLAEKGILFENAFSQAPWTLPAMATVHTSLYPTEHGVIEGYLKIKKNLLTLAEYMKNDFYKTMAVTTHAFVDGKHGFSQGFDIFDEKNHQGPYDCSSERITQKAIGLITSNKKNKFFLWVHYFDPHSAYIDHEEYSYGQEHSGNLPETLTASILNKSIDTLSPEDVQYVLDIYDEEVSYTDKSIGVLIDAVDALELKDDTVIIITSDHGEELLDRTRFGHGRYTYQELIHVPLIIYSPLEEKLKGRRVRHSVETRDIAKTVLEICGIEGSHFGGNNLLNVAEQSDAPSGYLAFSEGSSSGSRGTLNHAVIGDGWKLIKNLRGQTFELYDLESDPGEKTNHFESEEPGINKIRKNLVSKLDDFKKERLVELERVEFSKEEIEQLKALGYMQ